MSLVVNNNMMAANTARNLNAHYGRLATSTQRLSSGLRVSSAADDAAGLAIRELQRADIAALHQGARNANDAISMIQVADGSLGIIDEKLIRMKELAEQAATGTYDSTQRLMIESEYQAMASEITRIANATDFNGTKLLDGTLKGDHDGSGLISEGKMKIHFGTGNDSAEDYYYVEIGECTSEAFGLGNNSTWEDVQRRGVEAFKQSLQKSIKESDLEPTKKGELLAQIDKNGDALANILSNATDYKQAYKYLAEGDDKEFWVGNSDLMERYLAAAVTDANDANIYEKYIEGFGAQTSIDGAKLNDTAAWMAAKQTADGKATATYEEIYAEYLVVKGAAASIDDAKNNDGADWIAAAGAATGKATNEKIYAEYLAVKNAEASAEAVRQADANNNTTDWDDAVAAAQAAGEANLTDDVVYSYYLAAKGVHGTADDPADAITNDATDWATAKNNADAKTPPTDEDIYAQYLQNKGVVDDPENNDAATWTTAKNNADAKAKASEDGIYSQYLQDHGVPGDVATAHSTEEAITAASKYPEWETAKASLDDSALDDFWNGLRETEKQKLRYAWGQAAISKLAEGMDKALAGPLSDLINNAEPPLDFGDGAMLDKALADMKAKVGHMDFAGHTIETQEDAQQALDAINEAIVSKDKIRAHLGAAQNRLENTVSNLNIQAENLQAAESRISDVDVATEMTQFVRNQILTQSAVAMLSQANSLPQMAMQLIGG